MKKKVLSILIFAGLLIPICISAQKKKDPKKQARTTIKPIELNTVSDTISYALGANMVQGLPQYLAQMNVMADTTMISMEYTNRIADETDEAIKTVLTKEMKTKMDSAVAVNKKNLPLFLEGFAKAFNEEGDQYIYNSGIAIAGQVKTMLDRFDAESMGLDKDVVVNKDRFLSGFMASLTGEKQLIEDPQQLIQQISEKQRQEAESKEMDALKTQYQEQIDASEKFFAENKNKTGIIVRPSGLQYKVEKEGNGPIPKVGEQVQVHYQGTLLDGTVFDSSIERGQPAEFAVGQLIRGWNEALLLMPEGSKWTLYIPYDLGYNAMDQGMIKPFSSLIFEVELIEVAKKIAD